MLMENNGYSMGNSSRTMVKTFAVAQNLALALAIAAGAAVAANHTATDHINPPRSSHSNAFRHMHRHGNGGTSGESCPNKIYNDGELGIRKSTLSLNEVISCARMAGFEGRALAKIVGVALYESRLAPGSIESGCPQACAGPEPAQGILQLGNASDTKYDAFQVEGYKKPKGMSWRDVWRDPRESFRWAHAYVTTRGWGFWGSLRRHNVEKGLQQQVGREKFEKLLAENMNHKPRHEIRKRYSTMHLGKGMMDPGDYTLNAKAVIIRRNDGIISVLRL